MPLGMNERNIEYIYKYNERKYYELADDKLISKKILSENNYPIPKTICTVRYFYQLEEIEEKIRDFTEYVMKPAKGMGGGGILVFNGFEDGSWISASGEKFDIPKINHHAAMILSGVYSLDNTNDAVIFEEKIKLHDLFEKITYMGIPDIRIIVFKNQPIMAMLRIPTKKSNGRANLHAGGIGIGIDINTGITHISALNKSAVEINPDTGHKLTGIKLPYWDEIIRMSSKIHDIVPLGYMGIDFVIDKNNGPQILELNVRPGLEIQNVNGISLRTLLNSFEK